MVKVQRAICDCETKVFLLFNTKMTVILFTHNNFANQIANMQWQEEINKLQNKTTLSGKQLSSIEWWEI